MKRIGIISDTHGQLRQSAFSVLNGVDQILHAGDIGGPEVIQALGNIAPVTAVRGNMDHGPWAEALPLTDMIEFCETCFFILHDLNTLDLDPAAAGVTAVISGHTHQAFMKSVGGVLYFNPGSASAGRYGSPESVGIIELAHQRMIPRIIQIEL